VVLSNQTQADPPSIDPALLGQSFLNNAAGLPNGSLVTVGRDLPGQPTRGAYTNWPATSPTICRVTDLGLLAEDTASGDFRDCATQSDVVIVFDVCGYAAAADASGEYTDRVVISGSRVTVAGETACSPGFNIYGSGVDITGDDVIFRHVRVAASNEFCTVGGTNCGTTYDGINVSG
jgi:hypothetical protein